MKNKCSSSAGKFSARSSQKTIHALVYEGKKWIPNWSIILDMMPAVYILTKSDFQLAQSDCILARAIGND